MIYTWLNKGEDIRNAITEIENLKPNLLDSIIERLD